MQPAGLLRNRRGWLAAAAGQTIQPHLQSFTWIACVCVSIVVSPVAVLLHCVPESAVGKETRDRERDKRDKSKSTVSGKSKAKWGRNGIQVREEK